MNSRSLIKRLVPAKLFARVEPYGHWLEAILVQIKNGFPAKELKVIGVTGTDGKTSTCELIGQLLRTNGYKVAVLTTISIDYGDERGKVPNPSRLTTMGAAQLVRLIKQIKTGGAEWLVLETTSHALAQHRVWHVPFSIAVMTNINHEHLDYHGTFENYRSAKLRLFKQSNANRNGLRAGVINADDPSAKIFSSAVKRPLSYGIHAGDLRASDIKSTISGSSYTATLGIKTYQIKCNLPGNFNVYNSLAAIAVGNLIGLNPRQIEKGIADLKSVEGRMTSVDAGQDFSLIVDYAHTPDSFEKIFNEVKPYVQGRIICVFGSAGRRDEAKRAEQGKIAGKMCDIVVVTEEDDRDMDGTEILDQIASGAEQAGKQKDKDLFLIHDRPRAVKEAVSMAKNGDLVILLGKGHEKSILSNGPQAKELRHLPQDDADPRRVIKHDYDEVTVARDALKSLKR